MTHAGAVAARSTRSVTAKTSDVVLWRFGTAIITGVLLVAAFPPFDHGALAWIALVPLLVAIRDLSPRQAFGLGYLAGFVAFFGILAWIRVFGLPAWVVLAAYLALFVGVFAGLYRWTTNGRSPALFIWLVPVIWTSLEYARSVGPMGFPWATLGTAQHAYLPVIQIARVTGVFGISFVVALGNAALAAVLASRRRLPVLAPVLLVLVVVGWGMQAARPQQPGPLVAAALQPNVPQREKFDLAYAARNTEILQRLVRDAGRYRPELIVFPETALPQNLFGEGGALSRVGQWAREVRSTLIASSLENGVSNIAVTVAPNGEALSRYDKVHLVAFGEAGVHPGTRHDPLSSSAGTVGVAICFESIFPDVFRELVRNGAEVLAIITNDAWFDGTGGPAQHAAQAPLRAVESGRWIIRAANTGISMVIDPVGHVWAATPPGQETLVVGHLASSRVLTFYTKWGDLFAWGVIVSLMALVAPRVWMALIPEWHVPAFHQAVVAVVLPLVAVWAALQAGGTAWLWPGVLLAFLSILSFLQPPATWGLNRVRVLETAGAGLVVVLGLWALLVAAYREQGIPVTLNLPVAAWAAVAARQGVVALVAESWLRGMAFNGLANWKGWPVAVAGTTMLGMLLQTGLPVEALAWALLTGAAFGLIRARTGNVTGLVIPHALGNLLLGFLVSVR